MEFPKYVSWCPKEEAKSFFLMKYKPIYKNRIARYVRPCRKSYEQILKSLNDKTYSFTLEGSCLDFTDEKWDSVSDAEIILRAALLGITIDFIEYESALQDSNIELIDAHTHKTLFKCK